MKRSIIFCLFLAISYLNFPAVQAATPKPIQEKTSYGKFGSITLYKPTGTPNSLVLFVSGDGGWQKGVINMARFLAYQGAMVAGIDAKHYVEMLGKQHGGCSYPAADFEQLSMMLQRKYHFNSYQVPMLVGYSYGATLVYGILAQAPAGTFRGAIALGFSPDISINKPLCKGSGLSSHTMKEANMYYLDRAENLSAPFIVLNGEQDKVCSVGQAGDFLKGLKNVELISLKHVGHGFSLADHWLPQFKYAYSKLLSHERIAAPLTTLNTKMPIGITEKEVKQSKTLVFMISGDGGWTSFDQGIADSFASTGAFVVGLDAQKYFWNKQSPAEVAIETAQLLNYYMRLKNRSEVILMGYSFGACVMPFIASRLPAPLRTTVRTIGLLSPDVTGDFEIHVSDMLSFETEDPYNVVDELKKINGAEKICLFGSEEDRDTATRFAVTGSKIYILPGGHHFDDAYSLIVQKIL